MFENHDTAAHDYLDFGIPHGAADGVLMLRRNLLDSSFKSPYFSSFIFLSPLWLSRFGLFFQCLVY